MSNLCEKIDYKGHKIEIFYDDCESNNPLTEWEIPTTFAGINNRRYEAVTPDNFHTDLHDLHEWLKKHKSVVYLPLYLYDHSGLSCSTRSFVGRSHHGEWDSGLWGFVYMTKEKFEKFYGKKKNWRQQAEEIIKNDVKLFDQFISGDVYRFSIEKDGENIDGCGGYFGLDYAIREAKEVVDHEVKNTISNHLKQVKNWIKNHVPLINRQPLTI